MKNYIVQGQYLLKKTPIKTGYQYLITKSTTSYDIIMEDVVARRALIGPPSNRDIHQNFINGINCFMWNYVIGSVGKTTWIFIELFEPRGALLGYLVLE